MFLIAAFFNILSSYFIASIYGSILVIFVALFGLIVLNVEILSLFGAISKINLLLFSIINFIASFLFWKKKKYPLLKPNLDFKRIINALKLDKSLIILGLAFLFLLAATFILAVIMPSLEPDSQTYHFIRSVEFFEHKRLLHFETGDIRGLIMPFNSEIIYTWMYAFKNNFRGYGIVSFIAFLGGIAALFDIFIKFKVPYRKILWTIFILSSFPAVIIQMCSLQTDAVIGSLLLICIALFLKGTDGLVYFSSLAYCLALGTKSTAAIAFFSILFILVAFEILIFKDKSFSKIKKFILYSIVNFIIFSSYNYILNFIDYGNPLTNHAAYLWHKFWGGYKGFIANILHFFFQAFDFTGFKWGFYLNDHILNIKKAVFNMIHINQGTGCNIAWEQVNILADEQIVGFGILGFCVFLPCIFTSSIKPIINKSKKSIIYFVFGLAFIINILALSSSLGYMIYSIRFIVSFVMLSSFCLALTYRKKSILKPFIILFALFYMLFLSTNIARMQFKYVFKALQTSKFNLEKFEDICFRGKATNTLLLASQIYDTVLNDFKECKNIAVFKTTFSSLLYLKSLSKMGYKIDFLRTSNIENYDLNKYDLIIVEDEIQDDAVFTQDEIEINYTMSDSNIKFNSIEGVQCYYTGLNGEIDESIGRNCLGYDYIKRIKNFKEAKTKIFVPDGKSAKNNIRIHYFYKIKKSANIN